MMMMSLLVATQKSRGAEHDIREHVAHEKFCRLAIKG